MEKFDTFFILNTIVDMKIVFISSGSENIGIEYLSSTLKKAGHDVELVFDPAVFSGRYFLENETLNRFLSKKSLIVQEALELQPDLIAMSIYTSNFQWSLDIVRLLKDKRNIPVVFGGVHVTSVPEVVLNYSEVDYICVGEGERAIVELAESLEAGKKYPEIDNIWYKRNSDIIRNPVKPFVEDLNLCPFPDKELYQEKMPVMKNEYSIIAGRGCPYGCPYCSHSMYHRYYEEDYTYCRYRSVENVLEELKTQAQNAKTVAFEESNFMLKEEWLEEFSDRYKKEIDKPFAVNIRPHVIDEKRAQLLENAGCKLAYLGIQNASESLRKQILNRDETNDMIKESIDELQKHGIKVSVDHIFGLPKETKVSHLESVNFYADLNPDKVVSNWLMYYPGTEMIEIALEHSLIDEEFIEKVHHGLISTTRHSGGAHFDRIKEYRRIHLLMYLIPILPAKIIRFFTKEKRYKIFPASFILIKIALLIDAVKMKDWKTWLYIKFAFQGIGAGVKKRLNSLWKSLKQTFT